MPKLIKRLADGQFVAETDPFTSVSDEAELPPGDVIISLGRFQAEGERLLAEGRAVGVRIEPAEQVEALAYDLPRLALVAVAFPTYRRGRACTCATLLRERLGFTGEVRAVGDVLREQAGFMVRCGIDAFEPNDGADPAQWAHAVGRHRHVYQRAADRRVTAFQEREEG